MHQLVAHIAAAEATVWFRGAPGLPAAESLGQLRSFDLRLFAGDSSFSPQLARSLHSDDAYQVSVPEDALRNWVSQAVARVWDDRMAPAPFDSRRGWQLATRYGAVLADWAPVGELRYLRLTLREGAAREFAIVARPAVGEPPPLVGLPGVHDPRVLGVC